MSFKLRVDVILYFSLTMGDLEEFKKLIKENLQSKGILQQIQANLRSEIFKSLHEPQVTENGPVLCQENLVINELIREYLEYNRLSNSLSVFQLETETPRQGVDRNFVKCDLNLEEAGSNIQRLPLIYGIVSMLQSVNEHKKLKTVFKNNKNPLAAHSSSQYPQQEDEFRMEGAASVSKQYSFSFEEETSFTPQQRNSALEQVGGGGSGRQSAMSGGMGGYSMNDFENSSGDEGSFQRSKSPLANEDRPSDQSEDEDGYSDSVNVLAVEDLAPVE